MKYLTRKKLTYEYISSRVKSGSGGEPTLKKRSKSRSTLSERRLRAMTISSAPANTAMKKSVWTNWNWSGNTQQSLEKEQTTITTFSRKVDSRTDYFRHRNAEKYSCLPLPIFLNNTRNALVGVKLAGAFLVEVIIKDLWFFQDDL